MEVGPAGDDLPYHVLSMSGRWVVVQNAADVERALASREVDLHAACCFLATTPGAYFELQRRGLPARSTHEFASREDLDQIAWDNYQKASESTQRLDSLLHSQVPSFPTGLYPFQALEYELKHLADSIAFTCQELKSFCQSESPDEILYWHYGNDNADHSRESFHPDPANPGNFSLHPSGETVASLVLGHGTWFERLGVATRCLTAEASVARKSRLVRWRQRAGRLINPNRLQAFNVLGAPALRLRQTSGAQRLLVVGVADNITEFIKYAQSGYEAQVDWWTQQASHPVSLPRFTSIPLGDHIPTVSRAVNQAAELFQSSPGWPCWGGDSDGEGLIGEILRSKLAQFWKQRSPYLIWLYSRAIQYFQRYRPVAMISGTMASDNVQVIMQAAQVCGVPAVSFQHGGGYGYIESEWLKLSDLRAGLYAGYGPSGCGYLEDFAVQRGLAVRSVSLGWPKGSTFRDAPSTYSDKSHGTHYPTVVYAPTGLVGDRRYGPHHNPHDTEYCLYQVQLLQILARLPQVRILVKLHYKDLILNPLEGWINRLNDPKIEVLKREKFSSLLGVADLVILDCPTTTLIEAMAAGKEVLYLDTGTLRLTTQAEALLRQSVTWVEKNAAGWEEDLSNTVSESLHRSRTKPDAGAFLDAYASLDFHPDALWKALHDVNQLPNVTVSTGQTQE